MSSSEFKPSEAFLRKVDAGFVKFAFRYSKRRGGSYVYRGGETTIRAHIAAGYIRPLAIPSLGRPSFAALTDKGRDWLAARTRRSEPEGE